MIRDITIGQYYPIDSAVHRLDPRTKLFATMIFIISLFIADDIVSYIIASVVLAVVLLASKVPLKFMFRGLKSVILLLLMSVGFNMFLTPGEVIWKFYIFTVTREGLRMAVFMGLRLIYLVLGSSVLTLTTTPNALTDGMEKGLGFLKRFSVPVHEIAMMMSIALRFIPILLEETDKIMKAQMARGADFTSGGIIARAKAMIPLLVPLFICYKKGNRSCNGYGSKMLSWWRRQNQDETVKIQKSRLCSICMLYTVSTAWYSNKNF